MGANAVKPISRRTSAGARCVPERITVGSTILRAQTWLLPPRGSACASARLNTARQGRGSVPISRRRCQISPAADWDEFIALSGIRRRTAAPRPQYLRLHRKAGALLRHAG